MGGVQKGCRQPVNRFWRNSLIGSHQIARRIQPLKSKSRRPCGRKTAYRIGSKLHLRNLAPFGGFHQISRNTILANTLQHTPYIGHGFCRIPSFGESRQSQPKASLLFGGIFKPGKQGLALWHKAIQDSPLAGKHIGQNIGRSKIRRGRPRHWERKRCKTDWVIRCQRKRFGRWGNGSNLMPCRQCFTWNRPECIFHQLQGGHRIYIPNNHQNGVIGSVPFFIKCTQVGCRCFIKGRACAQCIMLVRRSGKQNGLQLFQITVSRAGQIARDFLLDRATFLVPVCFRKG